MNYSKTIPGWLSKGSHPIIPLIYLILPFCFLDIGIVHDGHKIGLLIGVFIILIMQIPNKWLKCFLLYVAISYIVVLIFNVIHNTSISNFDYSFMGQYHIANYFQQEYQTSLIFESLTFFIIGVLLYLFVAYSKIEIKWFYNAICITTIIQTIIGLIQMYGATPIQYVLSLGGCNTYQKMACGISTGTLGNNNFLAAMIAITIPFFIRKSWKVFIPFLLLFLLSLKTSMAILALVIGVGIYIHNLATMNFKQELIILISLISGALLYIFLIDTNFKGISIFNSWRINTWITTIQKLWSDKTALLFGFGPNAILPIKDKCPLHNEWLEGVYHYGLFGISFLCMYVATIFKENKILFTAFIIICVNAIGNYPMHLAPSAALIIIILGLIQRESKQYGRLFDFRKYIWSD